MKHSESIGAIAKALAAAQRAIRPAVRDATNPHFRSRYADLAAIDEACRPHLAANGIAILQASSFTDGCACCTTTLVHADSGEWFAATLSLPVERPTPQAIGSALTYARRYSLSSLAAVPAGDDDDGEAAEGRGDPRRVSGGASLTPSIPVPPPAAVVPFDPPVTLNVADLPEDYDGPPAYNAEELRVTHKERGGDKPSSPVYVMWTDVVGKIISITLPDGPKKPTRILLWNTLSQGGVYFSTFSRYDRPEGVGDWIMLKGVTSTERDGKRYWNFRNAVKAPSAGEAADGIPF